MDEGWRRKQMEMFDSNTILFLAFMTTAFPLVGVGIVRIMERL
jgi:hypothetical protein